MNFCHSSVNSLKYIATSVISANSLMDIYIYVLPPHLCKQFHIYLEDEDLVGAAPTGDAPTASEWSTILLPT